LLHNDHGFDQAPYEEIDENTYNKISSKVKGISSLQISKGNVLQDLECEGGACPIR